MSTRVTKLCERDYIVFAWLVREGILFDAHYELTQSDTRDHAYKLYEFIELQAGFEADEDIEKHHITPTEEDIPPEVSVWLTVAGDSNEVARPLVSAILRFGENIVTCQLCGVEVPAETAHRRENDWIGDECCWVE